MKKILICLLSVMLVMQLCGCNQSASRSGFQTTSQTVSCPSCSTVQSGNAYYCQNCGFKLSSEIACASCGKLNSADASFCGGCGIALSGVPAATFAPGGQTPTTPGEYQTGSAECFECAYAGLDDCIGHDCLVCGGRGYTECYAGCYNGCSFCDGGYVQCSCDNGKVYFSGGGGYSAPSAETTACSYCENGYVTCSLCGGSGRHGSYTTGGFDGTPGTEVATTCNMCHGAKKISCSYCGGDGEL